MIGSDILFQFLILIGAATAVATLFHYVKLPTIIGFIAAGALVGPYGLGLVSSVPGAKQLSEIGVLFLMFSIGLEFSLRRIRDLKKALLGLGVGQVILTSFLFGVISLVLFKMPPVHALFVGFLISLSSTAIVMKLMHEARDLETPYGNATVGTLIFQDLAFIPVMLALPLLGGSGIESVSLFSQQRLEIWALKFIVLTGGLFLAGKYVIPFAFEKIIKTRSKELFFFALILLCFGVAVAMGRWGGSYSLGAFVAGVIIAESSYAKQAIADVLPMRDNFLGLFFTSIGMLIDLNFFITHAHWILLFLLLVMTVKSGAIYGVARFLRYPVSIALVTGLILSQVGEFSFVLAEMGRQIGVLKEKELQYFFAISVLSMISTPFLYKLAPRFAFDTAYHSLGLLKSKGVFWNAEKTSEEKKTLSFNCHTVIIGYGVAGRNLSSVLKTLEIPYSIIEMNYETVTRAKKKGEPIFYGDASREDILLTAGIQTAKLVVIAASGASITPQVLRTVRTLRPDVEIIVRTQYLRELENLPKDSSADVVVAEFETTLEILARSLTIYGAPSQKIHKFLAEARRSIGKGSQSFNIPASVRRSLELPAWEALASIRPFKIEEGFAADGQSIAKINLRRLSGASIVSVYRPLSGTTIPDADFLLLANDIINLIGTPQAIKAAEDILHGGPPST